MVFTGWTGDLSGTVNPQTTTIHDEFLPAANLNLVPTIITATGVAGQIVRRLEPDPFWRRIRERQFLYLLSR